MKYDVLIRLGIMAIAPWNFSWLVQNELAAMAWPQTKSNLLFLLEQGVRQLITLSPEKLPPVAGFEGIGWEAIFVEEFEAPTIDQMVRFIDVCRKCKELKQPVGIHCKMGRGRTGVMAACYLVQFCGMTPERAISDVRLKRPGSVETFQQERAVMAYHDYIRRL